MTNANIMLIFDIIVLVLGIYILYQARYMKMNQEVPSLFVAPEEMQRCRNKKGFIQFFYSKAMIFGIVDLIFGLEGIYNDFLSTVNTALPQLNDIVNDIVLLVFLGVWIWFSIQLRKGKSEFF